MKETSKEGEKKIGKKWNDKSKNSTEMKKKRSK